MELHILEHRVRVLSLARPGLWLYTHPLIKLLFLPRRSRAAPVRVPASGRGHVAGAECVVSQRCGRTGRRGHQDRPISDRTAGRAPRVRADAVHLPDRLHPGAGAGPVRGDPHAGPGIRHLPRGGRRACACCQGRFQQWLSPCPAWRAQPHRAPHPEPTKPILRPHAGPRDSASHRHHPHRRPLLFA
uniref:Cytosolic arginine sensor for mTORC1 subunit 1 n=1 Tax=Ovis aries TaxID=9940 RepID=A0AC11EUP1_SHEEP